MSHLPDSETAPVDADPEYQDELDLDDPEFDDCEPDHDPPPDQGDADAVNPE